MFEITVITHFSGAHRLRYLHGRCEALHGHNWRIEVSVASRRLRKEGVLIDFKVLKEQVDEVVNSLDHRYLNDLPYFLKREPSSENIAKYLFDRLEGEVKRQGAVLRRVSAWESETAYASYLGGR